MLTRGKGLKSVWMTAAAVAAVAGSIWVGSDDKGSDSQMNAPAHVSDANPAVDLAEPEPARPSAPAEPRPPDNVSNRFVAVGFPDGTTVAVPLISTPFPGVRIRGGLTTVGDFYRQVAPRARAGDAAAAFELARKLRQCKELLAGEPSADPARLDFCRGAESSMLDEADIWRQMAIDAGYYFAMQDLAREFRGTPQELEIWESLWQRGHASALQVLRIRYAQGVAGSPPDHVRAYAYMLIYSGVLQAAFNELPSPTPTQQMMLVTVEDSLRQAGSYLSPGETATAVALAVQLLKNNPNCCIGRWH